jgi:riboflavin biosynthesis pyrimidine reductase
VDIVRLPTAIDRRVSFRPRTAAPCHDVAMSEASPLRRVQPAPAGATTVAEAYGMPRPIRADRPWVGVCMIASLDGSVVVDGRSGGLGNANDRDVLLTLRRAADVVIVGNATASGEGYGAPESGVRIGVVTNSGDIDVAGALFRSGAGFVITHAGAEVPSGVEVVRAGDAHVDLALALQRLDAIVPEVRYVHAEGGPTLNGALHAADLVDELDLTTAPLMVAGRGPRAALGDAELSRRFDLAHLLVDGDGYVFARWLRRDAGDTGVASTLS